MKKPDSLRAKFVSVFPELAKDPDRLKIWVEEGRVRCHAADPAVGENLSFTLEYPLIVAIDNWTHPSILVWIVLIDWLRVQQPDLLTPARSKEGIPFEADIISAKEVFIGFELQLTECVRATRREDGGFDLQVIEESDPMLPDTMPMIEDGGRLTTIWLDGTQLVPDPLAAPADD